MHNTPAMTRLTASYLETRALKFYPLIWDNPQVDPFLCGIQTSPRFSDPLHNTVPHKEPSAFLLLYLLSGVGTYEAIFFIITRHCLPFSLSFSQWSLPEVT